MALTHGLVLHAAHTGQASGRDQTRVTTRQHAHRAVASEADRVSTAAAPLGLPRYTDVNFGVLLVGTIAVPGSEYCSLIVGTDSACDEAPEIDVVNESQSASHCNSALRHTPSVKPANGLR